MENRGNILAIVVPCYNEEVILNVVINKLLKILGNLSNNNKISQNSYIMLVDDGSKDNTWEIIESNCCNNKHVKGIKLSKNFGHQYALYAGLCESEADMLISIDADLQDDVALIDTMIDKYYDGFEIVYGVRNDRNTDTIMKRVSASLYYKLTNLIGMNTISQHADFRLISGKVATELRKITETNLYLRGIIPNLGFKSTILYYKRQKRIGGNAKYNYFKSAKLALNGITSFSVFPLRIITFIGILNFLIAIIMILYTFYVFFEKRTITGWSSLFVSLYFIGGSILISVGILGEYIAKIYNETKNRPRYIIEKKLL